MIADGGARDAEAVEMVVTLHAENGTAEAIGIIGRSGQVETCFDKALALAVAAQIVADRIADPRSPTAASTASTRRFWATSA